MADKNNTLSSTKISVDRNFVSKIQPQGGISFRDESFIRTGDGYEACISIYDFPSQVDMNWLAVLTNIRGATVTVDIGVEDMNGIRRTINKSINEHKSRYASSKHDTDSADSVNRITELRELYNEIASEGEVIKLITVRIFVAGRTLQEVDDSIRSVTDMLDTYGFKGFINLNENQMDWTSVYKPYHKQQLEKNHREGQAMTAQVLAAGNPFHFTALTDPTGSYFGTTDTDGTVLFDMFRSSSTRSFYNAIAIGNMGTGKSTTLKKILKDRAIRGDYVRCFDGTGEYRKLINKLGGKIISLDGSEGVLNALEILKTDEREETCFARHLSKLSTLFKLLSPKSDSYEIMEFEQLIRDFYVAYGLLPKDPKATYTVTGKPAKDYPIWSDFLKYITARIEETKGTQDYVKDAVLREKVKRWDNIRLVILGLVKNYGTLFDGHTSIDNITDIPIVCFNIAQLKNMKEEVFNAQIFLAQSLWWDNCVRLGTEQKHLYDEGQLKPEDATHFLGIIDEAHTMINANKTVTLDQLLVFCREARKYFGGLLFASQSIRDFVPEGASSENVEKIKKLFELTQYKFIMRQDANSLNVLNSVFSQQLTPSELDEIPHLDRGDCILAISGDQNIRFHLFVTPRELEDFAGGA